MKTLIIGSEGSMGTRYQAMLKYMGRPFIKVDRDPLSYIISKANECDRIIIASPTFTHFEYINLFANHKKPILCEKPVCTKSVELEHVFTTLEQFKTEFTMMFQYSKLDQPSSSGPSFYNYFRHGHDGLIWDCFQIIALARGEVDVREISPVWRCQLNGVPLSLDHMDEAYLDFVDDWFQGFSHKISDLKKMHMKVQEMAVGHGKPN